VDNINVSRSVIKVIVMVVKSKCRLVVIVVEQNKKEIVGRESIPVNRPVETYWTVANIAVIRSVMLDNVSPVVYNLIY